MMDEHHSYHQAITGKEAEERLKMCGDHCYLTRYSEARGCYILSVYTKQNVKHFEISFEPSGDHKVYKISGKAEEFNAIEAMLAHYENHRIDPAIKTIGRCIKEQEWEAAMQTAKQQGEKYDKV